MKITLITGGSRGDVQPYLGLGVGLKEAGHDVTVLASSDFETLTQETGLGYCSTGVNAQAMLESNDWRDKLDGGNFLVILKQMRDELKKYSKTLTPALLAGCEDADLILCGMGGFLGGFAIAEYLNIPLIETHVFPMEPTTEFPSPITAGMHPGGWLNRLSFHAARQVLWQSLRVADGQVRDDLGLPSASFWGPYKSLSRRGVPSLFGYSRHVLPRPQDWSARHYVTGYWFLDAPSDWTPPQNLVTFLDSGTPPVYIGFGSMRSDNPEEMGQMALDALRQSGQRGVIASGWGGLRSQDLPESVFAVDSLPHSWLFPQMAAVVHHGGAGTTAAGLRAGVPSILVPFMGDQPFWGQRVAAIGAGPEAIPRQQLTADKLAAAIDTAVSDTAMQARAASLGEQIRAEKGVSQAVQLIEQFSEQPSMAVVT